MDLYTLHFKYTKITEDTKRKKVQIGNKFILYSWLGEKHEISEVGWRYHYDMFWEDVYTHVYICIHCMFWGVHVYTCVYLYSWYILGSIYIYTCTYLYICFEICLCLCVCVYVCACMMCRNWVFWSDCGCRTSKYIYLHIYSPEV